jgi:hypothetical protein
MSEAACEYVSSRGLMKSCDVYPSNPVSSTRRCYDYDWSALKPKSSVYIIGSSIPHFLQVAWPLIKVPFVLVTGDCDQSMPVDVVSESQFKSMVEDPKLVAWFSQNLVLEHPKLHPIPIGMDYHTLSENKGHSWGPNQTPQAQEQILKMLCERGDKQERLPQAYCNFQFSMNTRYAEDRRDALRDLSAGVVHYEPKAVTRFITWANQSKFKFVASPFGGGLDCHRTWEALALHCIPILHSSPLDKMFEGLPVLLVNSWTEVTPELLQRGLKGSMDKLQLSYWVALINKSKD